MNLAFFTKSFSRCAQSRSSFAKTFLYVREACKYTDKGNYFATYRKNNICVSCVFNGFKYTNEPRHEISNNVVCATNKASDQPAHRRSLIRASASRLNIL